MLRRIEPSTTRVLNRVRTLLRLAATGGWAVLPALLAALYLSSLAAPAAHAAAEAAPPPLAIAVFLSTRHDVCYDPGDVGAITTLARREQDRINRAGGIHGRKIQLRFLDDHAKPEATVSNVRSALSDPTTVAMIGLSNSNRAKAAFDSAGKELADSGIPVLSNISVTSIFKNAPNVLTTQASQDEERIPVMAQFIRKMKFERVAYAGVTENVFSTALGDGLRKRLGESGLVADQRMRAPGDVLDKDDLAAAVAAIKAKSPDLVVFGTGGDRAAALLTALVTADVRPALFLAGRIEQLPSELVTNYPSPIYQLAWDRLPEADNDRLRRVISSGDPERWIFEGSKISEAPGWAKGQCKSRPEVTVPDPMESANLRAIGLGAQFADMVALVAETARTGGPGLSTAGIRRHILKQLTTTYAAGHGVFKGSFETWSFHPETRTADRTPFVVIQPPGLGRTQLAPIQFARVKDGTLRQIDTLYLDVDLIRAHRVDDNAKTFFAEFYLSMRDQKNSGIEHIDFTNAFLDPSSNGRQITIEVLHNGGPSDSYPEGMKIYTVSGRFTFDPDMSRFPFDTQRFAINVQPKRADQPFVIQPPPLDLRDKAVATDGWDVKSQYVGYSQDFVPLLDAYTHAPSVVPFYKASFVWLMKRQTTDYFLRVVVPLGFILIIAYFSYFISTAHFEAIVTIQVTALLSAVALYLSLPKLDSDDATISDRLFVINYLLITVMIGISILRVSPYVTDRKWFKTTLRVAHALGIPLLLGGMALYVWRMTEL